MQLLLSFVFLALALATGINVYLTKNTLAHLAVSMLSSIASILSAWTAIYGATRFFFDPSKIVIDTFVLKLGISLPNHPSTDSVVFGNVWLIVVLLPLIAGCMLMRELRKVPPLQTSEPLQTNLV